MHWLPIGSVNRLPLFIAEPLPEQIMSYWIIMSFKISILTSVSSLCLIQWGWQHNTTSQLHESMSCRSTKTGHIYWHKSSHIRTDAFLAFWCLESLCLWQIWYKMWQAVNVQTIWTTNYEGVEYYPQCQDSGVVKLIEGILSQSFVPQIKWIIEGSHCGGAAADQRHLVSMFCYHDA